VNVFEFFIHATEVKMHLQHQIRDETMCPSWLNPHLSAPAVSEQQPGDMVRQLNKAVLLD
jgi:hypothetical protein